MRSMTRAAELTEMRDRGQSCKFGSLRISEVMNCNKTEVGDLESVKTSLMLVVQPQLRAWGNRGMTAAQTEPPPASKYR